MMFALSFVLSFLVAAHPAMAGDKIGNGGGVWACMPNGSVDPRQIFFVDFFEGREAHGWTMAEAAPGESPMAMADRMLSEIRSVFPAYVQLWENALNQTKAKIKYVSDAAELEVVDDALYQIRPSARSCAGGNWEYQQFANFNDQGEVLISEFFWSSPLLTVAEKAALIWHEALYLWFRTSFRDVNSVRARILTGLVFSTSSVAEKQQRLAKLLQTPLPAGEDWFCLVKNEMTYAMYGAYGPSELEASTAALQICQAGSQSFFCTENAVTCEAIRTDRISWTCVVRNSLNDSRYIGRGRAHAEARFLAQEGCQLNAGAHRDLFCVDSEPVCSRL